MFSMQSSKKKFKHGDTSRKVNPPGPDKKPLKCSICMSIHHLRNECPQRDQSSVVPYTPGQASSSSTPKGKPKGGPKGGSKGTKRGHVVDEDAQVHDGPHEDGFHVRVREEGSESPSFIDEHFCFHVREYDKYADSDEDEAWPTLSSIPQEHEDAFFVHQIVYPKEKDCC